MLLICTVAGLSYRAICEYKRASAASARCRQRRKEVVDLEQRSQEAVGLVIQRDQFPDRLFAPAKRETLLADGANPVYDKEMRSEIFSQGTLMLRLVIQVSMCSTLPLMAVCLSFAPAVRRGTWLRAAVQHARRPGVLGRQRYERTRTSDARSAAHDDDHAVADLVGQVARRITRVERVDALCFGRSPWLRCW